MDPRVKPAGDLGCSRWPAWRKAIDRARASLSRGHL